MVSSPVEISVVVPAYNEELRLSRTLLQLWKDVRRRFDSFEIIVVDDGSSDGTAALVDAFCVDHPEVRLVRYAQNRGKGYAVRRGVLCSCGDYVLFTDADLSTPLREVRKLQKAIAQADIAIGSRATRGAWIVEYQPYYRMLMGKTFNKIVQLLTVPGIKDTQCGFKCFRGELARMLFRCCRIDGFGFDVEVLYVARRAGFKISEVGVMWRNDPLSKVHPVWHSLKMLGELLQIRLNGFRGRYSLKTGARSSIEA